MQQATKYGSPLIVLLGLLLFPDNLSRYVLPIAIDLAGLATIFLACKPLREKNNAGAIVLLWLAPLALLWLLSERREGREVSQISVIIEILLAGVGTSFLVSKGGLKTEDLRFFIAVFLTWAVAYLSGSTGGADRMHPYFTFLGMTMDQIIRLVIWIRKFIHLSFYGSVTWLFATYIWNKIPNKKVLLGFCVAFPLWIASCDEFRQSFMPNRQGSVYDVMLDMSAASVVIIGLFLLEKRKRVVTTS